MEHLTVTLLSLVTSCTDNCTMGFGSLLPFFIYNKPTCGSMWMFIRYHSNRKHRNRASLCGIIRKFKYALTEATQSFFFLLSNTLPVLFYFVYDVSSRTQTNVFQKSWSQRTRQKAKGSVECLTGGSYSPTFNLTTHTQRTELWALSWHETQHRG